MLQTQHSTQRQSSQDVVVIKKEPCDMELSLPTLGTDKYTIDSESENVLKQPKTEPGTEENSQVTKDDDIFQSAKYSKSTKTFTCNFCRDIFETWNELTMHIADHKKSNGRAGRGEDDSSNAGVPEKRRKMSEVNISKDAQLTEMGQRIRVSEYDGRGDNTTSLDGLPFEPICNVQVKDEIVSDQSSCDDYYEEPHHVTYNNSQNMQNIEDYNIINDDNQNLVNTSSKTTNGRNFTNSKSSVCEMCGFKPKIPALMHAHVRNRHPDNYMEYVDNLKASGEWVVKCRICDVYLFSSTIYGQHLKYTHSQIVNDCSGYFECNHCDQTFSSKNDFFLHKNQAHNMRRINKAKQLFICLLCDKQFGRYQNLQQHEETHESNGTSAMAIGNGGNTGNSVGGTGSISRVSSISGSSGAYIPLLSGFLRKKRVEPPSPPAEELIEHPAFVPYPKTSPKKYANSNITTAAGGQYQCKGCDKSFATEFGLRVHIGCVHKGMEKLPPKKSNATMNAVASSPVAKQQPDLPLPPITTDNNNYCEICDRQFDSVAECSAHMQKHHEIANTYRERPIRCKECKFQCATRFEFTCHIKQKHKELYKKRFAALTNMDPKSEPCNLCFMPIFHTKYIRHMNTHYMSESERKEQDADETATPHPVKTPNINSKMTKVSTKDQTIRLNQNGKQIKYKCKLCSTFYPDKTSLMKHTLVVHKKADGRKQFNCKICFRTITGAQNFNSHMNRHKGEAAKSLPKK